MKIERNFNPDEWVREISGKEFRESGALWFVNTILHLFGMAITWNPDTDELKASVVRFRGFDVNSNDNGASAKDCNAIATQAYLLCNQVGA